MGWGYQHRCRQGVVSRFAASDSAESQLTGFGCAAKLKCGRDNWRGKREHAQTRATDLAWGEGGRERVGALWPHGLLQGGGAEAAFSAQHDLLVPSAAACARRLPPNAALARSGEP